MLKYKKTKQKQLKELLNKKKKKKELFLIKNIIKT